MTFTTPELLQRWKEANGDAEGKLWAIEVGWTGLENYAQRKDAAYIKLCLDAGRRPANFFKPEEAANAIEPTHIVHQYFELNERGFLVALFSNAAALA